MGKKRENFQNVGFSHKFAYDNKGKIDKIKNRQTGLEKKRTITTLYLKLHHIMCQLNLKKVGGKKEKTSGNTTKNIKTIAQSQKQENISSENGQN